MPTLLLSPRYSSDSRLLRAAAERAGWRVVRLGGRSIPDFVGGRDLVRLGLGPLRLRPGGGPPGARPRLGAAGVADRGGPAVDPATPAGRRTAATVNLNQVTVPVTDVARAAEFYRRLGLVQIVDSATYARFECPDGEATFSIERVNRVASAPGVVVYFECEDLDAQVAALSRAGITVDSGPRDEPWLWREARLRDPDGNAICLFSAGRNRRFPPWRLDPPLAGS